MIVVDCPQGTYEWHQARAGVITASMFKEVRARVGGLTEQQQRYVNAIRAGLDKAKAMELAGYRAVPKAQAIEKAIAGEQVGDYTNAAKDYAFRLAIERISWEPLGEGFETWAMRRGHELEPEARAAHAKRTGLKIKQTGLVLTDDHLFGASADGLIDPSGGAEYKCFLAPDKLRTIIVDRNTDDLKDQVQGCMWLTGRDWWHLCLYCPALEPAGKELTIFEQKRDDDYIEAMEQDLIAFNGFVQQCQQALQSDSKAA